MQTVAGIGIMLRFFRRYRYWFFLAILAIVLLVRVGLVMMFGVEGKVSEDNYYRIVNGMTLPEVEDILGANHGERSGVNEDGTKWTFAIWSGPKAWIIVTFSDGKVDSKEILRGRGGMPPSFPRP
jgi:hypothetical protein